MLFGDQGVLVEVYIDIPGDMGVSGLGGPPNNKERLLEVVVEVLVLQTGEPIIPKILQISEFLVRRQSGGQPRRIHVGEPLQQIRVQIPEVAGLPQSHFVGVIGVKLLQTVSNTLSNVGGVLQGIRGDS